MGKDAKTIDIGGGDSCLADRLLERGFTDITVLDISETKMISLLQQMFEKIKCLTLNHETPFSTVQNFIFCSFRKLHVS